MRRDELIRHAKIHLKNIKKGNKRSLGEKVGNPGAVAVALGVAHLSSNFNGYDQ